MHLDETSIHPFIHFLYAYTAQGYRRPEIYPSIHQVRGSAQNRQSFTRLIYREMYIFIHFIYFQGIIYNMERTDILLFDVLYQSQCVSTFASSPRGGCSYSTLCIVGPALDCRGPRFKSVAFLWLHHGTWSNTGQQHGTLLKSLCGFVRKIRKQQHMTNSNSHIECVTDRILVTFSMSLTLQSTYCCMQHAHNNTTLS